MHFKPIFMIRSKKQYDITKKHLIDFSNYLIVLEKVGREPTIHPILHKAQKDALQSQIDVFNDEMMEWEKSKVYSEEEARFMALTCVINALQPIMISMKQEKDFHDAWEKLIQL